MGNQRTSPLRAFVKKSSSPNKIGIGAMVGLGALVGGKIKKRRAAKRKARREALVTGEGGMADQMRNVMAQRRTMGGAVAYKEKNKK